MVKLTESIILTRTKQHEVDRVKKLNCWGCDLDDVSLLEQMTSVEVLALSMNNIETLAPMAHCQNLRELYLRQNRISDISELRYLQYCPNLRVLWLGENPCADIPNYRLRVISYLPQLHNLDNRLITMDEVDQARSQSAAGGPDSQSHNDPGGHSFNRTPPPAYSRQSIDSMQPPPEPYYEPQQIIAAPIPMLPPMPQHRGTPPPIQRQTTPPRQPISPATPAMIHQQMQHSPHGQMGQPQEIYHHPAAPIYSHQPMSQSIHHSQPPVQYVPVYQPQPMHASTYGLMNGSVCYVSEPMPNPMTSSMIMYSSQISEAPAPSHVTPVRSASGECRSENILNAVVTLLDELDVNDLQVVLNETEARIRQSGDQPLLATLCSATGATPSSIPNVVPNHIPSSTPNTVSNAVSNPIPNAVPNAVPNPIPNSTPNATPNRTPNRTPSAISPQIPSSQESQISPGAVAAVVAAAATAAAANSPPADNPNPSPQPPAAALIELN